MLNNFVAIINPIFEAFRLKKQCFNYVIKSEGTVAAF